MSGKLLDTNAVINFIKGIPSAVNTVTKFEIVDVRKKHECLL